MIWYNGRQGVIMEIKKKGILKMLCRAKQLACVLILLLTTTSVYGAASIKEIYELQEKCGKSSAEFFKHMYGSGHEVKGILQFYDCHYNKKLNKCFIRIGNICNNEEGKQESLMLELHDVQGNKQYGFFSESSDKMTCLVLDKICRSKEQWNTLAKPYMEE
jgi:hypothetical protein